MGEALRVVRDTEALRSFVIIAVMVQLVAWPLLNLLPQISTDIGENAIIFSLLLLSLYAGMALVAPILTIREKQYSHWHIAIVALIILMIATTLVALAPLVSEGVRLVVLMIVLVPLGMALNMTSVLTSAAVQTGAPREHVPGGARALLGSHHRHRARGGAGDHRDRRCVERVDRRTRRGSRHRRPSALPELAEGASPPRDGIV